MLYYTISITYNIELSKVTYRYLTTRVKYILIPYILMGLFYSYSESLLTNSSFNKQFVENVLLGQWYGYFIVVIMQFFILSYIIFKINYNLFNSKILLLLSFIVQQTFLYYFSNNSAFHDTVLHYYPLSENTLILGWIFYFFLGAYLGYKLRACLKFLRTLFSYYDCFSCSNILCIYCVGKWGLLECYKFLIFINTI